jgi:ribosomal protein RSM22 (predicted rRNA methylase)
VPSLRACIDEALMATSAKRLAPTVERLIETYRSGDAASAPILSTAADVLAYAAYRMPATYAVAHAVLSAMQAAAPDLQPQTLVDFGAGTGAFGWAATELWPTVTELSLLEQAEHAMALGKSLAQASGRSTLQTARWISWRVGDADHDIVGDVASAAYVLGELSSGQRTRLLDTMAATAPVVVLIEPGTPGGFARIIAARDALIGCGHTIIAPCPHEHVCPLAAKHDWCHFAARLDRSRLHRVVKGGDMSYEDEKFAYVVATRTGDAGDAKTRAARIVRHPRQRKGLVSLQLCTASGTAVEQLVAKSAGSAYRFARNARWGSTWSLAPTEGSLAPTEGPAPPTEESAMPDDAAAKDLEALAKKHVDEMPAETALGNADPEGGGEGTPADYVAEHEGKGGK